MQRVEKRRPAVIGLWILVAFGGSSLVGLVFSIVAARALGPADFSLFSSITFLFVLAGVGVMGVSTATTRSMTELATERPQSPPLSSLQAILAAAVVGAVFGGAFLLASPILSLVLDSPLRFLVVACMLVPILVMSGGGYGRLYGAGMYRLAQATVIAENLTKLAAGIGAAFLGLGIIGFELAFAAGPLVATLLAVLLTHRHPRRRLAAFSRAVWGTTLAMALLVGATQIDIPLSRVFFSPDVAGSYAAVATAAKGVVAVALVGGQVMMRRAAAEVSSGAPRRSVRRASTYALVAAAPFAALLVIAGPPLIERLYGPAFAPARSVVTAVAVAAVPWAGCAAVLQVRLTKVPSIRLLLPLALAAASLPSLCFIGSWFGLTAFALAGALVGLLLLIALRSDWIDAPGSETESHGIA